MQALRKSRKTWFNALSVACICQKATAFWLIKNIIAVKHTANKLMTTTILAEGHLAAKNSPHWRPLGLLNLYRLIIAGLFFFSNFKYGDRLWSVSYHNELYFQVASSYLAASLLAILLTSLEWPGFNRQLTFFTVADIIFIALLMHAAGGLVSGLGILMIVTIAAASLISQGRLALFYASLATIALLLQQSIQLWLLQDQYESYSYTHAVMLSLGCFATAWLAHSFAKRTRQSEAIATQRSADLKNLSKINELIAQEMGDGVLVVDRDLNIRHNNAQAEKLLGMYPQGWRDLPLAEISPEIAALLYNWTSDIGLNDSGLVKLQLRDKELRIRFMPIGGDKTHGAVIFIDDWSHVQTQAQQIKLAALGRLTANIAHEIRNPLSAISHANQLLQEDEQIDLGAQRMLQIISDNVQRLDQIVKDVLELNRRDRTHQEIFPLEVFLEDFHEQFCAVEKIPPEGFALQIENTHSTPVAFDKRHLNQILWNLCRNGWQHGKQAAGSLSLTLRQGRDLRIEIADDGPGVPSNIRTHLFEPFFTTKNTGTGLGLYIAQELSEANGAHIQYEAIENGSKFVILMKKANA